MKWNPKTPPPSITAHHAVATVAEALGREAFDALRHDNEFHKMCQEYDLDEKEFLAYFAPYFRKGARTLMTAQLQDPLVPELQKQDIMDALTMDQILPKTGVSAVKKRNI